MRISEGRELPPGNLEISIIYLRIVLCCLVRCSALADGSVFWDFGVRSVRKQRGS